MLLEKRKINFGGKGKGGIWWKGVLVKKRKVYFGGEGSPINKVLPKNPFLYLKPKIFYFDYYLVPILLLILKTIIIIIVKNFFVVI